MRSLQQPYLPGLRHPDGERQSSTSIRLSISSSCPRCSRPSLMCRNVRIRLMPGLPLRPVAENPLTMTQLPIPTTPNSPTFSPLVGYRVAKSYVEVLADGTRADCLDAGQLR